MSNRGEKPALSLRNLDQKSQFADSIRLGLKRLIDITGSASLLILLSPLFVLICSSIRLSSGAPVFYWQRRIGRFGVTFRMFKFRTMYPQFSDELPRMSSEGTIEKRADDERITRLGRLLRRTSLDELPQLINVLLGDMSLVGPRPLPAAMLTGDPKAMSIRASLRPGMTGLWQVHNRAANRSVFDMLPYDLEYAKRISLRRDCRILLQTITVVIRGTGAI